MFADTHTFLAQRASLARWNERSWGLNLAEKESAWGNAYTKIVRGLKANTTFNKWLDASLALGEKTREPAARAWNLSHVNRLLTSDARSSLGVFAVFVLPHTDTLRFAFPQTDENYRKFRAPFRPSTLDKAEFSDREVLLHRQLQMTFSQDPIEQEGHICKSMMKAALLSRKSLYCPDTSALRENDYSKPYEVPGTSVRFVSLHSIAELSWGVASVCYVPIAFSPDRCSLALCLYSPFRNLFGPGPQPFSATLPPEFVDDFMSTIFDEIDYQILVEADFQTRTAVKRAIGRSYENVKHLLERKVPNAVREMLERERVNDTVIDEVVNAIRRVLDDPHLGALHLNARVLNAETNFSDSGVTASGIDRLKRFLTQSVEMLRKQQGLPKISLAVAPITEERPESKATEIEELIICAARAFVQNMEKYAKACSIPVVVALRPVSSASAFWELSISNPTTLDAALVRSYWTAKEGIFPRDTSDASGGSGLQLFALKIICEGAPKLSRIVHIEYELQADSNPSSDICTWTSKVTFPGPNWVSGSSIGG